KVRGDRVRAQQQVLDAFAAAAGGLRESPVTPSVTHLEVALEVAGKGTQTRRFRVLGQPVGMYLDGSLQSGALWSSYVEEVRQDKDAQRMEFGDDETHGGGGDSGPAPDSADAVAVLGQNFAAIGACARAEAERNPKF